MAVGAGRWGAVDAVRREKEIAGQQSGGVHGDELRLLGGGIERGTNARHILQQACRTSVMERPLHGGHSAASHFSPFHRGGAAASRRQRDFRGRSRTYYANLRSGRATAMHKICRGYAIYVRPEGPLVQEARKAQAAEAAPQRRPQEKEAEKPSLYPRGHERLLLTMSDLELAITELLRHSVFGRRGVSGAQIQLMLSGHAEKLTETLVGVVSIPPPDYPACCAGVLTGLCLCGAWSCSEKLRRNARGRIQRERYYPVHKQDVCWLFANRIRAWLRLITKPQLDPAMSSKRESMLDDTRQQRDQVCRITNAVQTPTHHPDHLEESTAKPGLRTLVHLADQATPR